MKKRLLPLSSTFNICHVSDVTASRLCHISQNMSSIPCDEAIFAFGIIEKLQGKNSCHVSVVLLWNSFRFLCLQFIKSTQIQSGNQSFVFSESVVFENSELAFIGTDLCRFRWIGLLNNEWITIYNSLVYSIYTVLNIFRPSEKIQMLPQVYHNLLRFYVTTRVRFHLFWNPGQGRSIQWVKWRPRLVNPSNNDSQHDDNHDNNEKPLNMWQWILFRRIQSQSVLHQWVLLQISNL